MTVATFSSVSPVGFSKSDTHLLFGYGFPFPSKRLSVSSKAFKSMAALTGASMWVFYSRVFLFSFDFFFGCPFVICLDTPIMSIKYVTPVQ